MATRRVLLPLGLVVVALSAPPAPAQNPGPPGVPSEESVQNFLKNFEKEDRQALAEGNYDVIRRNNDVSAFIMGCVGRRLKSEYAIELCEQRLAREKARDPHDVWSRAYTIKDLVRLYQAAGRHDRAIALLEEFARWNREEYGDRNRYTLLVRRELADALTQAEKYDRAADAYRELLADSPEEAVNLLTELLGVYQKAGNFDQEYATGKKILEKIKAQGGGPGDPRAHRVRLMLAKRCQEVGKPDLALEMIEGDLRESRKDNGPDHPTTLALMPFAAERYLETGQPDKALALLTEAADRRRKGQGADHLDTVLAEYGLAEGQRRAGKAEEATKTFAAVLPKMKDKLTPQDPRLQAALASLAELYESAGKAADAEPLRRDALEVQRKAMPWPGAPQVSLALALLGLNLLQQEKWSEAEKTLRECLELRRKYEAQVWSTYNAMSLLGASLAGQKKYEEAEPLLLEGYEGMKQREATIPPQARFRLTEALRRLVKLYEDTGRKDKADEYRKQLPATGP